MTPIEVVRQLTERMSALDAVGALECFDDDARAEIMLLPGFADPNHQDYGDIARAMKWGIKQFTRWDITITQEWQTTDPEVVITDIRMPPSGDGEGIAIAAGLRESNPEIGVVVLSQYVELAYAMSLMGLGTSRRAYLLKDRTRGHYRKLLDNHILPMLGDKPVAKITGDDVREWHAATLTDKPTMRAHAYSLLRTILNTAISDGKRTEANPCTIRGAPGVE